ncbi:hypothetical protein ACLUW3_06540 [Limosilactobacillus reuteri subsp. suis]|uniref:hypothetical protein n=1 Tax=Limosilactobacillus reuteri TaxID=1598 RepID=UPI003994D69C
MLKVNTLFIMIASILVLLIIPGLASFYGGLVNRRHANNMLLTVFMMCGLAVILWITVGYSLSFSGNHWGIIGNLNNILMIHVPIDAITKTGVMDIILIKLLSIVLPFSIDNEKLAAIQSK